MSGNFVSAWAERAPWTRSIDVLLKDKDGGYVTDLVITRLEPGQMPLIEPSLRLTYESAQELMDHLWACGLRPTEGSGSAGALAATEKHLEDMRQLSEKLLAKVLA